MASTSRPTGKGPLSGGEAMVNAPSADWVPAAMFEDSRCSKTKDGVLKFVARGTLCRSLGVIC